MSTINAQAAEEMKAKLREAADALDAAQAAGTEEAAVAAEEAVKKAEATAEKHKDELKKDKKAWTLLSHTWNKLRGLWNALVEMFRSKKTEEQMQETKPPFRARIRTLAAKVAAGLCLTPMLGMVGAILLGVLVLKTVLLPFALLYVLYHRVRHGSWNVYTTKGEAFEAPETEEVMTEEVTTEEVVDDFDRPSFSAV